MVQNTIARISRSPWAFPNVIAPKKGVDAQSFDPRMCTDFRELNDITVKDAHPIPRIDDILASLREGANYYSTLDLTSGYYQIGLTKRAQERSAFVTPDGHWEYLRMPFGLCNAPATFQRMMNGIFADMIGKNVLVYLDDLTIFTNTFKQHLTALEEVFKRLREEGLYLKPKKCTFAAHSMKFHGFVVDNQGLRTDPDKIEAVSRFPRPTTRTYKLFRDHVSAISHFSGVTTNDVYKIPAKQFDQTLSTLYNDFPPIALPDLDEDLFLTA